MHTDDCSLVRTFVEAQCEFDDSFYTYTYILTESFNRMYGKTLDAASFSRYLNQAFGDRFVSRKRRMDGCNLNGFFGLRLKSNDILEGEMSNA